ncbi:lipase family protein [Streptomyces sp. NPDC001292]|uniref:lipase family protein n=1 Tax=Streptomyces sp. NPDC001292 TaxID=3364558 RepID=UPI00369089E1
MSDAWSHDEVIYPELGRILSESQGERNEEIAYALAICAGYAYAEVKGGADKVTLRKRLARVGLQDNTCKPIELSVDAMFIDSTAFVVRACEGKVAILCYRGTEIADLTDWLTDIDTEPETYSFPQAPDRRNWRVHSGFYRSTRATWDDVMAELASAGPEALYITGHSLGGAMAAMAGVMLRKDQDPRHRQVRDALKAVYTYGQPMIGNVEFARECQADPFLRDNVIRHVHRNDIVPHLPPVATGPFAHFGTEFRYLNDPPGLESPSGYWRRNASARQAGMIDFALTPWEFVARRIPMAGSLVARWRPIGAKIEAVADRVEKAADTLHVPFGRPPSFVCYSIEDHAPHHYIAKLATPGVLSEFERERTSVS